jgi:hypothetical protein
LLALARVIIRAKAKPVAVAAMTARAERLLGSGLLLKRGLLGLSRSCGAVRIGHAEGYPPGGGGRHGGGGKGGVKSSD